MKNLTIALLLLAMSSVALAADNKPKKIIKKTVVTTVEEVEDTETQSAVAPEVEKGPKVVKDEFVLENSSAHHRMDKKYIAWAQLIGFGPFVMSSTELAFGYYLNRNDIVYAQIMGGSDESKHADGTGYDVDSDGIGVHWKVFSGNSFYFDGGVDFRKIRYEYSNSYSPTRSSFDATQTSLSFAIGNQWQWSNFTLGCDWVGISYPLLHDITNSKITAGSSYDNTRFEDDKKDYVEKTSGQLLHFYLGASF